MPYLTFFSKMTHNNGNKNDPKKAGIAGTALEKSGNKFLVMGQWHSHGEVGLENTHRFLRGLAIPPDAQMLAGQF